MDDVGIGGSDITSQQLLPALRAVLDRFVCSRALWCQLSDAIGTPAAAVAAPEALSARQRARTLRCREHTWCCDRPVSHFIQCRKWKIVNSVSDSQRTRLTLNPGQKTTGYLPPNDGAKTAFKDADIIIIPAGIPRS